MNRLNSDIQNIEKKLENKTLTRQMRKHLKKTLARKKRQQLYLPKEPTSIRFNETMKIRQLPPENMNISPIEFYTAIRGNKPRYPRSRTKTRKVYQARNPYPEYLANRNRSGKTAKQKKYKEAMQAYLEKIEKS